jgi:hypothetical protein
MGIFKSRNLDDAVTKILLGSNFVIKRWTEYAGVQTFFFPFTSPTNFGASQIISLPLSKIGITPICNNLLAELDSKSASEESVLVKAVSAKSFKIQNATEFDSLGASLGTTDYLKTIFLVSSDSKNPGTLRSLRLREASSEGVAYTPLLKYTNNDLPLQFLGDLTSDDPRQVFEFFIQINWHKGDISSAVVHLFLPYDMSFYTKICRELNDAALKHPN